MRWLELLLDNYVILLIVLAAFSSLLKKTGRKPNRTERKRPSAPMPPFGGEPWPAPFPGWGKGRAEQAEQTSPRQPAPVIKEPEKPVQKSEPEQRAVQTIARMAPRTAEQTAAQTTSQTPPPFLSAPSDSEKSVRTRQTGPLLEMGYAKEELMRGVLWAEVLGPPRAKRPYRYFGAKKEN